MNKRLWNAVHEFGKWIQHDVPIASRVFEPLRNLFAAVLADRDEAIDAAVYRALAECDRRYKPRLSGKDKLAQEFAKLDTPSTILCPKCGNLANWTSHFQKYICENDACAWFGIKPDPPAECDKQTRLLIANHETGYVHVPAPEQDTIIPKEGDIVWHSETSQLVHITSIHEGGHYDFESMNGAFKYSGGKIGKGHHFRSCEPPAANTEPEMETCPVCKGFKGWNDYSQGGAKWIVCPKCQSTGEVPKPVEPECDEATDAQPAVVWDEKFLAWATDEFGLVQLDRPDEDDGVWLVDGRHFHESDLTIPTAEQLSGMIGETRVIAWEDKFDNIHIVDQYNYDVSCFLIARAICAPDKFNIPILTHRQITVQMKGVVPRLEGK